MSHGRSTGESPYVYDVATGESQQDCDSALGEPPHACSAMDEQLVANAYREMYHCLIDRDASGLDDLLDEPFELEYSSWCKLPKYDLIEEVVGGFQNCFHVEHEDLDVQLYGDNAHLTGRSLVDGALFGEDRNLWPLQMDIDLLRQGNGWLMTKAHASTY